MRPGVQAPCSSTGWQPFRRRHKVRTDRGFSNGQGHIHMFPTPPLPPRPFRNSKVTSSYVRFQILTIWIMPGCRNLNAYCLDPGSRCVKRGKLEPLLDPGATLSIYLFIYLCIYKHTYIYIYIYIYPKGHKRLTTPAAWCNQQASMCSGPSRWRWPPRR